MQMDENDPNEGIVDRIGFVSDKDMPSTSRERLVALVMLEDSSTTYRIREVMMDDFAAVALTRRGDRISLFADGEDVRSFTNQETGSTASLAEFDFK